MISFVKIIDEKVEIFCLAKKSVGEFFEQLRPTKKFKTT